jgi:hypothetical protein
VIGAAGECKILQRSTPQLEPFEQAGASIVHQFELNRPAGLLLNDSGSCSNFSITNDIADPDLHQIAASKFTIDGEVKEGPVPDPSMLIEKEADRPDLARFERSLRTNLTSGVPRYPLASGGIKLG